MMVQDVRAAVGKREGLIQNLFKNATFSFDSLHSKLAFLGGNLLARIFIIYLFVKYINELTIDILFII
jgi:hypothetical protein